MKSISFSIPRVVSAVQHTESPIESILFNEMMRSGNFVLCQDGDCPSGEGRFIFPQLVVGPYRADFIIRAIAYPINARVWPPRLQKTVCVECDGKDFHSSPEQVQYDLDRDAYFQNNGIETIRFSGAEIKKRPRSCVDEIISRLHTSMDSEK